MRSICVYCGSRPGTDPDHARLAEAAGYAIARRGHRMVFGGGDSGLMGVAARAALAGGATVLGIIPEFLIPMEGVVDGIDVRKVATMGARKAMMINESDAFLVLPGGTGTLEEVFDVLTRRALKLEMKPVAFVDGAFWAPFEALLAHTQRYGFTDQALTKGFSFEPDVETALSTLEQRLLDTAA